MKIDAAAVGEDLPIARVVPRHQQLEHHEVGEQDVGLERADALALRLAFLPGIAGEGRAERIG